MDYSYSKDVCVNAFEEKNLLKYWVVAERGETATVAKWLEHPPREQEIMGSILGSDRPQSLKLVLVAFPLGPQDFGNSTTIGLPV